jgi:hypothetical protein
MSGQTRRAAAMVLLILVTGAAAAAHVMTVMGTVAAVEPARIQVKTGEENAGESPAWFTIDEKTKIMRGRTVVTFEDANIVAGERVVLSVDHADDGTTKTLEIRLAAR